MKIFLTAEGDSVYNKNRKREEEMHGKDRV